MANTDFRSVDEYLAQKPAGTRKILARVRAAIRQAVPEAEEAISYQIPAYKLEGSPVLFFAGWQEHFSLYPASAPLVAAFERELAAYEVSKGTIRFPLSAAIPTSLIARLAKFRAKEARAYVKARAAKRQLKALQRRANAEKTPKTPPGRKGAKTATSVTRTSGRKRAKTVATAVRTSGRKGAQPGAKIAKSGQRKLDARRVKAR